MRKTLAPLLAVLTALLLALTACGGSTSAASKEPPAKRLAAAKKAFDDATGVHIDLKTEDLPSTVSGVLTASGTGTHQPGFDGTIKVFQSGLSVSVPIIAVDGKVHVKLGTWQVIDPGQYSAPDPAALMSPTAGLSSLLTEATGLSPGTQKRSGSATVTEITAKVPGSDVAHIIPTAAADQDFKATFTLDDQDRLTRAVLTGKFYPKAGDVTYTLDFGDYGTSTTVKAP